MQTPPPEARALMEKHRANAERKEAIALKEQAADLRRAAMIPIRYRDHNLEGLKTKGEAQALLKARLIDYIKVSYKKGGSLLAHGDKGTGKTTAICAMLNFLMEKGQSAEYMNASELVYRIKATWNSGSKETELDILNSIASRNIIVIDEVAESPRQTSLRGMAHEGNNYDQATYVRKVIDARYQRRKPTVLISNRTPEELAALLGDAYLERITGDGGMSIEVKGESLR
jgi:DNA replication protein DnaC